MLNSICICSKAHVSFRCIFYKEHINYSFCLHREFLKVQIIFVLFFRSKGKQLLSKNLIFSPAQHIVNPITAFSHRWPKSDGREHAASKVCQVSQHPQNTAC